MSNGFNDDELADIMNEIESLEQEFTEVGSTVTADVVDSPGHLEVLSDLAEKPESVSSGESVEAHDDVHCITEAKKKRETKVSSEHTPSSMSFNVSGDMKLDLKFVISGKEVKLNISESSFDLELEDGMKFSIPIKGQHSKSNVA